MSQPLHGTDMERGLELFNRAHFFDAHEALEDAWRETPRGTHRRRHLQGLVQLAVAFHHESTHNVIGARSVLDRALRNLGGAEDSFPDLDLDRLRKEMAHWQQHLASGAAGSDRPAAPHIARRKSTR
jgi:predicted metal-dependent hydrolase